MTSEQTQIAALPRQVAPAWAVKLIAEMKARKVAAAPVVLPAGLRAAAARQQARQQTKGHGSHYGAAKFTGAWSGADMAKQPLSIPADLGVSLDLRALISGHTRATRAWEIAQNKADRCRRRALRQPRKAGITDAKILRAHGWPALAKAERKASDAMDRIELLCTHFSARTVGDLAAKLLFAAYYYDLEGPGIDGDAVASAISDAVRLAKR